MGQVEIPENWIVVGTITITKCVDEDGMVRLVTYGDEGLSTFEGIGMCIYTVDKMRKALQEDK